MLPLRKRLSARLPATPCTQEMRDAMVKLAHENQCDLAELQRAAFSLFLLSPDTKSVTDDTNNVKEAVQS